MARTGRPPIPVEQKRKVGTLRADRPGGGSSAALAAVGAADPADHELTVGEALDRVMERGVVWLAVTDQPTICLLRDTVELYADLREDSRAKPGDVIAAGKRVQELLSTLGFDPTSRARLGLAEVKAQSKLEELAERRRGR